MNGKVKALMIAALVTGLVVSAIYMVPALAYMNGTADQDRDRDQDRDQDRLRGKNCVCDCTCDGTPDRDQTRTRLHLQECIQNRQATGQLAMQYVCQHQYQHRERIMGFA